MVIVGVGRGSTTLFAAPTDTVNPGPYSQVGAVQPYVHPNEFSGTALYARLGASGGPGFAVHDTTGLAPNGNYDEITLAAVEVIGGSRIEDFAWNEVVQGSQPVPVTSGNVTTTGPATLVAFWWGDLTATTDQTAIANNGFTVIESALAAGSLVQCAVAVKTVAQAGSYNVTWTATPLQGAQLWLVAVQ